MKKTRVLIIEDEKLIRWSLVQRFTESGYAVVEAESGGEGLEKLRQATFDLLLLDYKLPDLTGLQVLQRVREIDEDLVVVMMTAFSTVENAVEAIRLGAFDYVSKPFKMDELMLTVEKGLETTRLKRQVRDFREQMKSQFGIERIIGRCSAMQALFQTIRDVARSGASTVFLRGPSGTGKDLVAKTIHYNSDRADQPFMNITCTALSENLLESELFGHERGAFTDAKSQKAGLLELADGGTVFLDEIGDMASGMQSKLLRFLEEKAFRRVGGATDIEVDVRIIAATNRDIENAVKDGAFRDDLFWRLNIIPVYLPPLCERDEDIELLAAHFLDRFAREFRKDVRGFDAAAMDALRAYRWPGNVRELRNAIERAVLLSRGNVLSIDDFVLGGPRSGDDVFDFRLPPQGVTLEEVESQLIRQALKQTGGNQTQAAKLLRLTRDQLRYRLNKYGME